MSRVDELSCEFVITIPDKLAAGTLYVSMEYATVVHRCCCGCGNEVVTPLSPTDWKLTYDGEGISLHPSIGNWSFKCRSHYWIRGSAVQWAGPMTDDEIRKGREQDQKAKASYFDAYEPGPLGAAPMHVGRWSTLVTSICGILRKWLVR